MEISIAPNFSSFRKQTSTYQISFNTLVYKYKIQEKRFEYKCNYTIHKCNDGIQEKQFEYKCNYTMHKKINTNHKIIKKTKSKK